MPDVGFGRFLEVNMQRFRVLAFLLVVPLGLAACGDDDPVTLSANVT